MKPEFTKNGWKRACPQCGADCFYTLRGNCAAAIKNKKLCKICGAKKAARFGEANQFYGKRHKPETIEALATGHKAEWDSFSDAEKAERRQRLTLLREKKRQKPQLSNYAYDVKKYGKERAGEKKLITSLKRSAAFSGSLNPMYGKPAPKNAGTGWKGWLDGVFFRSLRELSFMLEYPSAKTGESNYWRAKYNFFGSDRTTVPDFILEKEKIVVECKPVRLHRTPLVSAKAEAMEQLAASRGYGFWLYDPPIISIQILDSLVESGRVKLTDKTKEAINVWRITHP